MKRILFAFAPLYVDFNHGIALLSALCKAQNIDTELILLNDMDSFLLRLDSNKYDHIGFSCVTIHDYIQALPYMTAAAQRGLSVLLGGVFVQRMQPKLTFAKTCTGEGELLPLFINYGADTVLNSYICNDLDTLPLPDYDLFDGIPYNRDVSWLPLDTKFLPYYSSRGCPYRCRFCEVNFQRPAYQRVRYKVEQDVNFLINRYDPDVLVLGDALPPYYDERWRESWGSVLYPFICYIRADIKESELRWLYDRGLTGCFFGIESGNEQYRNQVLGKNLLDRDIMRTVEILREMNVPFMAAYMRGTPDETWELQGETAKFAEEIGGYPVVYNYENLSVR